MNNKNFGIVKTELHKTGMKKKNHVGTITLWVAFNRINFIICGLRCSHIQHAENLLQVDGPLVWNCSHVGIPAASTISNNIKSANARVSNVIATLNRVHVFVACKPVLTLHLENISSFFLLPLPTCCSLLLFGFVLRAYTVQGGYVFFTCLWPDRICFGTDVSRGHIRHLISHLIG